MVLTTTVGMFEASIVLPAGTGNIVNPSTIPIVQASGVVMSTSQTVVSVCGVANLAKSSPPCVAVYPNSI